MKNKDHIVLQFSGGTDSTLAAALISQRYEKIHLLTYNRFGFTNISNSKFNVTKLRNKYGQKKFIHKIINIDKLTRFVFYERYLYNLCKNGFFLINMCGLCKLAMHIQTIIYCVENDILNACDGANKGMDIFPAQMEEGIKEIKFLYSQFNINFSNPVFDFDGPDERGITDRLNFEKILPNMKDNELESSDKNNTTGDKLYELNLMPSKNVKGTELDRKMQARCFQFILFNIFVKWYFLNNHTYKDYEGAVNKFYKNKIDYFIPLIKNYIKNPNNSKLSKLLVSK